MNNFYQLSICVDHQETDEKLATRYVNCLKFSIQDGLSMHRVRNVEEAYQLALKDDENQNRQFVQRNRGERSGTLSPLHGSFKYGRGKSSQGDEKVEDSQQNNPNPPRESGFRRGRGYNAGRGTPIVCFRCSEEGHQEFEFLNYNMQETKQGDTHILNLA